jgi:hypothetical protein
VTDKAKPENPLHNLAFNIFLPVIVLNQLSKRIGENGPEIALVIALALPIGYGAYDYIKRKKHNLISALGIINVAFTGGFALLKFEGIWFAVKEAFFPLLIGISVYVANLWGRPLMKTLFWSESVFRVEAIEKVLKERQAESQLKELFHKTTFLFSLSFFISSILNFVLASQIFVEISSTLDATKRSEILNDQISQMTWKGYVVIALPMMIFMGIIMWYLIHKLKKITGYKTEDLLHTSQQEAK